MKKGGKLAVKGERNVLSTSLEKNKAYFQSQFSNAMDLIVRQVEIEGRAVALFAVDGLSLIHISKLRWRAIRTVGRPPCSMP